MLTIGNLLQLEDLSLAVTKITDAGLVDLQKLSRLATLELSETSVSDAGLQTLAGLTNLRSLDLCKTQITDAGLPSLAALKNLDDLNVENAAITPSAIERLRAASYRIVRSRVDTPRMICPVGSNALRGPVFRALFVCNAPQNSIIMISA